MKRVLETDGEAHRTIWMYSIPLHATLTNSKFYVMCLSPQFKNIYEKKKILEWEVGDIHYFQIGNLTTAFSTKNIEVRRQLNDIFQEKKRTANLDFYAQ